jgi:hypothetical protein
VFTSLYLVASVGLVVGLVLAVLAVIKGRSVPQRRVPWIVALVVLGTDALLHVVASLAFMVAAMEVSGWTEVGWFVIGTLGFLAILAVGVLRPRWAGWCLLASAVVVPLVFAVGGLTVQSDAAGQPPWPIGLMFYSIPAAVTGGLFLFSTTARRGSAGEVTAGAEPQAAR